ncbi:catalase family peroxidase [Cellulomonas sp. McL0617]|uniref:catalase family peroxidase n=1 Tax=Cellulomonas sp. McL0617 TaxID=3415675 RepID=UPI003CECB5A5
MTTAFDQTTPDTDRTDPFQRVIDNLDANFGVAPARRAAHAKGAVLTGLFNPSVEAPSVSRAAHFAGRVQVVARFSSFPGGAPHPDAEPECNPRGLAVQFRLCDGGTTDLLAHSINGFPGRTVDDFSDFLGAIAPTSPGPQEYLAGHPAAAAFVHAVQTHGVPASFATLPYFPVNAFRFHAQDGTETTGRYIWTPVAGHHVLTDAEAATKSDNFLTDELRTRLQSEAVSFVLELQVAEPGDITDDANAQWPQTRRRVKLGTLHLTDLVPESAAAEQGLFFDPVRLVDGITLSDDPLLVGRTRTYPLSLARRHSDG